jgi:hypothetical protein
MRIKPFGNALKIPFVFRMSEKHRLRLQKCQPTFRYRTSVRSIHSRSKCVVYKTPHAPLFPITSNCFPFGHSSILKSIPAIRIQVGLLGAECNILNPYELGKYTLACCVSGSRLENRTTACVVLLKWVCVIDSNNIISSYRGYFVEYRVTDMVLKFRDT